MASVRGMDRSTPRIDGSGLKYCSGCQRRKPLDDFHLRSASPDGRHGFCKQCRSLGRRVQPICDPPGLKTCRRCGEVKARSEFHNSAGSSDGLQSHCKPCANVNPASRDRKLRAKYGIGQAEYSALLAEQGGGCRICGTKEPLTKNRNNFVVDHCHKTGRVRGLLCVRCNLLISYADDDPVVLAAAIRYLS